jgi:hypothetical protein
VAGGKRKKTQVVYSTRVTARILVNRGCGTPDAFPQAIQPALKETPVSNPSSTLKSNNNDIPQEMVELAEAIDQLPQEYRDKIGPSLGRVIDSTRRRRRILSLVQDALGQLRLDMKYLAFDLEATRRERDDYRRQLDEKP